MNAKEIVGVSLYAEDPKEIINIIESNISTRDEDILAACAHAIGHLVRRFSIDVSFLRDRIEKKSTELGNPNFLSGAIEDMDADIALFLKR